MTDGIFGIRPGSRVALLLDNASVYHDAQRQAGIAVDYGRLRRLIESEAGEEILVRYYALMHPDTTVYNPLVNTVHWMRTNGIEVKARNGRLMMRDTGRTQIVGTMLPDLCADMQKFADKRTFDTLIVACNSLDILNVVVDIRNEGVGVIGLLGSRIEPEQRNAFSHYVLWPEIANEVSRPTQGLGIRKETGRSFPGPLNPAIPASVGESIRPAPVQPDRTDAGPLPGSGDQPDPLEDLLGMSDDMPAAFAPRSSQPGPQWAEQPDIDLSRSAAPPQRTPQQAAQAVEPATPTIGVQDGIGVSGRRRQTAYKGALAKVQAETLGTASSRRPTTLSLKRS